MRLEQLDKHLGRPLDERELGLAGGDLCVVHDVAENKESVFELKALGLQAVQGHFEGDRPPDDARAHYAPYPSCLDLHFQFRDF